MQLSPDMGDWREYNAAGSINFYDVIYCRGVYVTVGSNDGFTGGGISWSDTGLTWNSANHVILATNPLYGVTCGENGMIAVGQSGLILKSIDGKDWSVTGAGVTNNALFHAVYANSRYLVVGDNGTVVTSNDHGETWTASSMGIEKWFGSIIYAEK